MTAIITKQNAKDKAFIGGGSSGGGGSDFIDENGNAELNDLHVKGNTTLDGSVSFTTEGMTIKDIINKANESYDISIYTQSDVIELNTSMNKMFTQRDERIDTIEQTVYYDHGPRIQELENEINNQHNDYFTQIEGIEEFKFNKDNLTATEDDNNYYLYFNNTPTIPENYEGNIFEYEVIRLILGLDIK